MENKITINFATAYDSNKLFFYGLPQIEIGTR
jgi:hypothetical protein